MSRDKCEKYEFHGLYGFIMEGYNVENFKHWWWAYRNDPFDYNVRPLGPFSSFEEANKAAIKEFKGE